MTRIASGVGMVLSLLAHGLLVGEAAETNAPALRPHEAAMSAPVNGLDRVRLDVITIGDPDSDGQYNPTVYFSLFSPGGRVSRGHAMSIRGLFATNANPSLLTIKNSVTAYVQQYAGTNLVAYREPKKPEPVMSVVYVAPTPPEPAPVTEAAPDPAPEPDAEPEQIPEATPEVTPDPPLEPAPSPPVEPPPAEPEPTPEEPVAP